MAPKQNGSGRLLTVKEFAELEGISTQAIYKRLSGQLKNYVVYIGKNGRDIRIRPEGLSDDAKGRLPTSYQPTNQPVANQDPKNREKTSPDADILVGNHSYQPVANQETKNEENPRDDADISVGNQGCKPNAKKTNKISQNQPVTNRELEDLRDMIRILNEQIQTKDEQIRAKDDQIRNMDNQITTMLETIDNLTRITDNAQKLQGHTQALLAEKSGRSGFVKWLYAVFLDTPTNQQ